VVKAIGAAVAHPDRLRSFLVEASSSLGEHGKHAPVGISVRRQGVFGGELEIPLTGIHCCRCRLRTPQRTSRGISSVEDSTPDLNIVSG